MAAAMVERLRDTVFPSLLAMGNDAFKVVTKDQLTSLTALMEALLLSYRVGNFKLPLPTTPAAPARLLLEAAQKGEAADQADDDAAGTGAKRACVGRWALVCQLTSVCVPCVV